MPAKLRFFLLIVLVSVATVHDGWGAPKYTVMHSFTGGDDGGYVWGSLTLGKKGGVYGTTRGGGDHNGGVAFELSPIRGGHWREAVLYNFCSASGCMDGGASVAGVTSDAPGNLFGTTQEGGPLGYGAVFELSPQPGGTWAETVLHGFHSGDYGGCWPESGVIIDDDGNVYGTPDGGIYELSKGSGGWNYDVLHQFPAQKGDGWGSFAGVIRDSAGNLYGTTEYGGSSKNCDAGCGTVYKLHPKADGTWQEMILHDFGAPGDGTTPGSGALAMDNSGNLYGTTESDAIYKLAPRSAVEWKETILYDAKGQEPVGGVVIDKAGALYGTTSAGGAYRCGTVFKLAPAPKDKWRYTVLHTFSGLDGCVPHSNLIFGRNGNLYGTAILGGVYGVGVAFELTP